MGRTPMPMTKLPQVPRCAYCGSYLIGGKKSCQTCGAKAGS